MENESRQRAWASQSVKKIEADFNRSADTHLHKLALPAAPDIHLYLKDESTHPTGSLKHRLARSLFLYGLCNGWIQEGTAIIEASSGNTAISEAYFAKLLGLPFIAVMPRGTSNEKIAQIEFHGGACHLVDHPSQIYEASRQLAAERNGHFMDQFTFAERATDWRGNNNIAESIFQQLRQEPYPNPAWVVVSAGTGGTSATIGRYIRYLRTQTRLCVPDPDHSVFYDYYRTRNAALRLDRGSGVEGIGRPRVEPSFIPDIIDRMVRVPDAATYAAMRFLEDTLGRKVGGSTGTNLYGAFRIIADMAAYGESGSVVTLICDAGDRYLDTYFNDAWLAEQGHDIAPYREQIDAFYHTGQWRDV